MSDPFLDQESSTEDGSVVELFEIIVSTGVAYRHTSGTRDVLYDGKRFSAIPIERGSVSISTLDTGDETDLLLPLDHGLVRRWTALGSPPKLVTVTVYAMQADGTTEVIWDGVITDMGWDDKAAKFRVPSRLSAASAHVLPNVTCGTTCPHMLFDATCALSRNGSGPTGVAYKVTTTALLVDGREVRVDLGTTSRNGSWAKGGELVHGPTGEPMLIVGQSDESSGVNGIARLTMQAPIVELKTGDEVTVYVGCDRTITTCRDKFDNVQRFGGYPNLPTRNIFLNGFLTNGVF